MTGDRPGEFTEQQLLLGDALHRATMTSSPISGHMLSWMNDWRIGDVVIEWTTSYRQRKWQSRIGVMTRVYDEPRFEDDGVTQFATTRHWVLTTNDGELDWHNADFFRIPTNEHQLRLLEGRADRCVVCGDCRHCERETWRQRAGSVLWEQVLRTQIFRRHRDDTDRTTPGTAPGNG